MDSETASATYYACLLFYVGCRGVVANEPGLYLVGLFFLYAMSWGFFRGVGRDTEYVVKDLASRAR